MNKSFETDFTDLSAVTPCCNTATSLNDLRYEWPAGFARFVLSAMNPNVLDIAEEQIHQLEQIIGCTLKRIWQHI